MAIYDRVAVLTTTTGTGTITLGAAVSKFRSFTDASIPNATVVPYVIEDGFEWEIGTGTYSTPAETLTRSVTSSSNSNNPLNLSGLAIVFIDVTAATLSDVALSNDYNDLDNLPTLGTAAATASTDYATAAQGSLADSAVQPAAIANMLETGDIGSTVQGYDADTAKVDVIQQWTAGQRSERTALSVSSNNINWTLASSNDFTVTLDANATLQLPSDVATYVGQKGTILITQDGSGSKTFAVASGFVILNDSVLPSVLSGAGTRTMLFYEVISTTEILISLGGVGASL